ncbi:MAG TPA: tyrosine-type recombinase/integrase [Acidimicrobiales bacterium]
MDQISKHPKSTQPAKAYSLARAILNQAVADELIRVNPCRVKGAGRESAPERPIVMPDQVAAIAGAMTDRYRAMVFLGSYCSLRFGELAGLRRRRVDLLHRRLILDPEIGNAVGLRGGVVSFRPPKADSARTVAIPAGLIEILEHHLEHFVGADSDALVFTTPAGDPLHRAKFRKPWAAALAGAGIAPIHFHDLRGSGATWAATSGATLRELMARLGHSTAVMAIRYQHATEERDQEIANCLDALMRAAAVVSEPEPEVISIGS